MSEPMTFSRLYLPRPLAAIDLEELIRRLAAADAPRPLAFEVRADNDGIQYMVGAAIARLSHMRRLVSGVVPGIVYGDADRSQLRVAARITAERHGLPTSTPDADLVSRCILGALASRRPGETVALQVVLGATRAPEFIPSDVRDPFQGVMSKLLHGTRSAHADVRRRLAGHASEPRLQLTLRVAVDASDAGRRRALALAVFGSLQPIEAAGHTLRLTIESPRRFHEAQARFGGLQLTPAEVVPLLGWPLGERDYPGVDPIHPKRLPVPASVSSTESVFAVGTAPGPERLVGVTAEARLSHLGVLAPTGAGKSEAVLAPLLLSDVKAGRPVVLVDPKGQLVDYVLDCLEPNLAERVVIFDPSDPEGTAGLNPLDIGSRDPYVVVDSILAVFKSVFADGWGPRTEDILHSALLTLALDGQGRETPHTLLDLPRLLTDDAFRRAVVPATVNEPELARFWARYESLGAAQREHEIAAPMNKLRRYLTRRGVTAILGQPRPAFRLRDVFKGNRIVLVALNEALGGAETSRLIGGLVCSEVFMAAQERAPEHDPRRRPGFIYVDEVARFLALPISLSSALEISRSFGVGWALFGQGSYQLSTELTQAFEINTRNKVTFATNPDDARAIARQAPALTAEDILGLPKYEVYANVLTADGPSGWFSAKTLPPPVRLGHGPAIRSAVRQRATPSAPARPDVSPDLPTPAPPAPTESTEFRRRRRS